MRLGLVTDIHSHVAELAQAVRLFRDHGVEQVVSIGDAIDAFGHRDGAADVVRLLESSNAVGVWGNHDFGLCRDDSGKQLGRLGLLASKFLEGVRPAMEIDGCYFSHKDASVDPNDVMQLWSIEDDPLDLLSRAMAGLAAAPHGRQFVGHYHQWWVAASRGHINWDGSAPLLLQPEERYFVVMNAVFQGWCAVLDTNAGILQPLRCAAS